MASFNLTAELNLRGPSNLNQVVSNIRRQLSTISLNLNINPSTSRGIQAVTADVRNLSVALRDAQSNAVALSTTLRGLGAATSNVARATTSLSSNLGNISGSASGTAKSIKAASSEMTEFGRQSALAIRRFAAFSVATGAVYTLSRAITSAYAEFVNFNKEFVRLQQVTDSTASGLTSLSNEITRLSTSLGVSSQELLQVSVTLAQAGLSAGETKTALEALAKSALAPSFDNLNDTVEGSIALMRQFGISASDLEGSLGSVNAVAAKFAVEASDIIAAIQRTGGVFANASRGVSEGKDALNEFLAVFTSVRATTRESAETIATGLRTIFTRIQRASTIDALKQYGISLTDLEGKFVGPYEAVKRLSEGLKSLDPRDLRFSKIVEELGGFRQIGKVIPLIQQFETAQKALGVAQRGAGSLAIDAATAQEALSVRINKVREQFVGLIRDIGQSQGFQTFVDISLKLASALISVADAAKDVLPALAAITAIRGVGALGQFFGGFTGGLSRNRTRGFASGGLVPGSGNRDTVGAMLMPGEFVIRKKAVQSIGAENLAKLNRGGYAKRRKGIAGAPLIDDIPQATGSLLPKPSAVEALIKAGGGAVDIDRTIKRTIGDKAYGSAKTDREKTAALQKYFRDPKQRLRDIQSAPLTSFGESLRKAIQAGQLNPRKLSIISKSQRVPGVAEYLSELFGIPTANMIFTQGGDKQPALNALRSKGPRIDRVKRFAFGGRSTAGIRRGSRSRFRELTSEEIAQLSTEDMIKYAKAQARDVFSTGGAGIVTSSKFVPVPQERIVPELESSLQTYLGQKGFWQEQVAPFATPDKKIGKVKSKLSREKSLKRQTSRLSDEVAARAQEWTKITSGSPIDNYLLGALKEPILSDYRSVRGGGSLAKPFHNTRLRQAVNKALDQYDDFDYSSGNIDKFVSAFAAKKFADGGLVQKFAQKQIKYNSGLVKSVEEAGGFEQLINKNMIGADGSYNFGLVALRSGTSKGSRVENRNIGKTGKRARIHIGTLSDQQQYDNIEKNITTSLKNIINKTGKGLAGSLGVSAASGSERKQILSGAVLSSATGSIFEAALQMIGAPYIDKIESIKSIDFPFGLGSVGEKFKIPNNIPTDATRTVGGSGKGLSSFLGQITRFLTSVDKKQFTKSLPSIGKQTGSQEKLLNSAMVSQENRQKINSILTKYGLPNIGTKLPAASKKMLFQGLSTNQEAAKELRDLEYFASGGSAGPDTVKALLTPGEFVINKKTAQRIGAAKLNRLNKADKIQGFNKGGSVGHVQRFAAGGSALPARSATPTPFNMVVPPNTISALQEIAAALENMGVSASEAAILLERGGAISVNASERAYRTDLNRLRIAGASASDIYNAEQRLAEVREQNATKIRTSQQFSGLTGAQLQDIQSGAELGRQRIIENRRSVMQSRGRSADEIQAALADSDFQDYARRTAFERSTSAVTGRSTRDLQRAGIGGQDIEAYVNQSMMNTSTLRQMDQQLLETRRQQLRNETAYTSASAAQQRRMMRELNARTNEEIAERKNIVNQLRKDRGLSGGFFSPTLSNLGGALQTGGALFGMGNLREDAFGMNPGRQRFARGFNRASELTQRAGFGLTFAGGLIGDTIGKMRGGKEGEATSAAISAFVGTAGIGMMFGPIGALTGVVVGATTAIEAWKESIIAATLQDEADKIEHANKKLQDSFERASKSKDLPETQAALRSAASEFDKIFVAENKRQTQLSNEAMPEEGILGSIFRYITGFRGENGDLLNPKAFQMPGLEKELVSSAKQSNILQTLPQQFELGIQRGLSLQQIEATFAPGQLDRMKEMFAIASAGPDMRGEAGVLAGLVARRESMRREGGDTAAIDTAIKNISNKIFNEDFLKGLQTRIKAEQSIAAATAAATIEINLLNQSLNKIGSASSKAAAQFEEAQRQIQMQKSVMFGGGQIPGPNRSQENVLENILSYSVNEIRNLILQIGSEFSFNPSLVREAQSAAVNQKILQQELPRILAEVSAREKDTFNPEGASADVIRRKLDEVFKKFIENPNQRRGTIDRVIGKLEERLKSRKDTTIEALSQDESTLADIMKSDEKVLAVFGDLLKQSNDILEQVNAGMNEFVANLSTATDMKIDAQNLSIEAGNELAKALGQELSLADLNQAFDNTITMLTQKIGPGGVGVPGTGTLDPATIMQRMTEKEKEARDIQDQLDKEKPPVGSDKFSDLSESLKRAKLEASNLSKAHQKLQSDSSRAANALTKISELRQVQENKQTSFLDLLKNVNNPEAMAEFTNEVQSFFAQMAGQGNLQNLPAAINGLERQMAVLPPGKAQSVREDFIKSLQGTTGLAPDVLQSIIDNITGVSPEMAGLIGEFYKYTDIQKDAINQASNKLIAGAKIAAQSLIDAGMEVRRTIFEGGQDNPREIIPAQPVQMRNKGGMIYASKGQYVNYQPKGTDTVPAMLTPGEFVVNAKATKKHRGLLQTINSNSKAGGYSRGGVVYLEGGGLAELRKTYPNLTEEELQQLLVQQQDNKEDLAKVAVSNTAPKEDPYAGMNERQKMLAMREDQYEASQKTKREAFRTQTGRDPKTGEIGGEKVPLTDAEKRANRDRASRIALAQIPEEQRTQDQQERYGALQQDFLESLTPEQKERRSQAERIALARIPEAEKTQDQKERYNKLQQDFVDNLSPEQRANRDRASRIALAQIPEEQRTQDQQERYNKLQEDFLNNLSPEQRANRESAIRIAALRARDIAKTPVKEKNAENRGEELAKKFGWSLPSTKPNGTVVGVYDGLEAGEEPFELKKLSAADRQALDDYQMAQVSAVERAERQKRKDESAAASEAAWTQTKADIDTQVEAERKKKEAEEARVLAEIQKQTHYIQKTPEQSRLELDASVRKRLEEGRLQDQAAAAARKKDDEQKKAQRQEEEKRALEERVQSIADSIQIDPITGGMLNADPTALQAEISKLEAREQQELAQLREFYAKEPSKVLTPEKHYARFSDTDDKLKELNTMLQGITRARTSFDTRRSAEIAETEEEYQRFKAIAEGRKRGTIAGRDAEEYARLSLIRGIKPGQINAGMGDIVAAERSIRDESLGQQGRVALEAAEKKDFETGLAAQRIEGGLAPAQFYGDLLGTAGKVVRTALTTGSVSETAKSVVPGYGSTGRDLLRAYGGAGLEDTYGNAAAGFLTEIFTDPFSATALLKGGAKATTTALSAVKRTPRTQLNKTAIAAATGGKGTGSSTVSRSIGVGSEGVDDVTRSSVPTRQKPFDFTRPHDTVETVGVSTTDVTSSPGIGAAAGGDLTIGLRLREVSEAFGEASPEVSANLNSLVEKQARVASQLAEATGSISTTNVPMTTPLSDLFPKTTTGKALSETVSTGVSTKSGTSITQIGPSRLLSDDKMAMRLLEGGTDTAATVAKQAATELATREATEQAAETVVAAATKPRSPTKFSPQTRSLTEKAGLDPSKVDEVAAAEEAKNLQRQASRQAKDAATKTGSAAGTKTGGKKVYEITEDMGRITAADKKAAARAVTEAQRTSKKAGGKKTLSPEIMAMSEEQLAQRLLTLETKIAATKSQKVRSFEFDAFGKKGKAVKTQLKELESEKRLLQQRLSGIAPKYKSSGGTIYANKGTLVPYQPRGTDTVPAMLTPGEFVVNRKSAKQNMGLLKAINSGHNIKPLGFNKGGMVPTQYYDVGGGVTASSSGGGGVSSISVDASALDAAFNNFNSYVGSLSSVIDGFTQGTTELAGLSQAIGTLGNLGLKEGAALMANAGISVKDATTAFSSAMTQFNSSATSLATAISSIPKSISLTVSGSIPVTVSVTIEGGGGTVDTAQLEQSIMDKVATAINSATQGGINIDTAIA